MGAATPPSMATNATVCDQETGEQVGANTGFHHRVPVLYHLVETRPEVVGVVLSPNKQRYHGGQTASGLRNGGRGNPS